MPTGLEPINHTYIPSPSNPAKEFSFVDDDRWIESHDTEGIGILTSVIPDAVSQDLSGLIAKTYHNLFFEKIYVVPRVINVGNLVNDQEVIIEVFNAYTVQNKILAEVLEDGLSSGVILNYDVPKTIKSMQSTYFTLEISLIGDILFDVYYTFNFASANDPILHVLGERVIPWPFKVNWADLPEESIEYLTIIQESDSEREKAIRRRYFPRRKLKYSYAPLSETNNVDESMEFLNLLDANIRSGQNRLYAVGEEQDAEQLLENLSIGDIEVSVNTIGKDYDVGAFLMLWKSPTEIETIEIEEVNEDSVILKRALLNNWPQFKTKIMPARLARMHASENIKLESIMQSTFDVEWEVEAYEESINRIIIPILSTYRGFDVWLVEPKMNDNTNNQYEISRKMIRLDSNSGGVRIIANTDTSRGRFTRQLFFQDRQEFAEFLGWLDIRKGKLKPVWIPTWQKNFILNNDLGSSSTQMVVQGNLFSKRYFNQENRNHIMIRLNDGTLYFRKIESSLASTSTETLTLDSPLGVLIHPNQVDRICFLQFCRLDSDNVKIVYESTSKMRTNFKLRELVKSL